MNNNKIGEIKSKLDYLQNKFYKLADTIPKDQLDQKVHGNESGWTAIETLRHIAISEQAIVDLMYSVSKGKGGVSEDFSLSKMNESNRQRDQAMTLNETKLVMKNSRKNTLDFLENATEEDWNATGRYFNGDIMTVFRMFEILMWHQNHHIKQILAKIS